MDKTGDVGVRGKQWQRLLRWHRGQKRTEDGEDGAKDEGKPNTNLDLKSNIK